MPVITNGKWLPRLLLPQKRTLTLDDGRLIVRSQVIANINFFFFLLSITNFKVCFLFFNYFFNLVVANRMKIERSLLNFLFLRLF